MLLTPDTLGVDNDLIEAYRDALSLPFESSEHRRVAVKIVNERLWHRGLANHGDGVMNDQAPSFGGDWTKRKLDILERYLDAYTTALKRQSFKLMYIDAFAGTGTVTLSSQDDDDAKSFILGSVRRALNIKDKLFDKLILIERNENRCKELEHLRSEYPGRNIHIENSDANEYLTSMQEDWRQWRGVLFLDPFATAVKWSTLETIASLEALDTWILFPVSAVARMLPRERLPNYTEQLTSVFGDDSWRNLYDESAQQSFFQEKEYGREPGIDRLVHVYKKNLKTLFGSRLLDNSQTLYNSKNSPLFEFIFCVGNPRGTKIAKDIAGHLLRDI